MMKKCKLIFTINLLKCLFCLFLYFIFFFFSFECFAQNASVAINSNGFSGDNSAMLDISSTNQGMLIPRVALTNTTSSFPITNPANSLLVYDSATTGDITPGFYYWDSSKWVRLATGNSGGWSTSGNAGTDTSSNFIGTTDAQSWVMKTDNIERMKISKTGNVGIGTSNPASSAILDVSSTTKGLRMPNMNTNQRDAISSPSTGLQIYNTDCNEVNYYNGSCWLPISVPLGDPGLITTDVTVFCANTSHTYTITNVPNATKYVWTVPAGASVTSGQGTTSATVLFGNISGDICVRASNLCEISPTSCIEVSVNPLADTPGGITGLNTVYPKQASVTYSIAGSGSYTWTVPSGVTIMSGQGTNTIIVDFACSAISGNISVAASNGCGLGSASSLAVTVTTLIANAGANVNTSICPNATTIGPVTGSGGTTPYTYSWSPSSAISGSSTIVNPLPLCANSSATYTVTVTDNKGCTATSSMNFTFGATASPTTLTLNYTGGPLNWTVPANVNSLSIKVWGAGGGGQYPSGQGPGGGGG
ncbi:MAG: hypothetical protein HGB12_08520, partial [Bacteroidetes bacterium]|nr:hypothetical protein [Bacteroidota bacterium]